MIKYTFSIYMLVILSTCYAQIESNLEDSKTDSLDKIKEDSIQLAHKNSHQFSYTSEYTSKVVFRGRDFGLQQYGVTNNFEYKNPSGFYATLNNYSWSGIYTFIAKTDIGLGFEKEIGKYLTINACYEKWFFADDPFFDPNSLNNMFSADVSTNFDKLNFDLGYYYIWGNDAALLLSLTTDYRIDLPSFSENIYLAIDPTLLGEAFAGDNSVAILNKKGKKRKTAPIYLQQDLSMANYEFSLPLSIEYKNITITPTYHYSYPIALSDEDPPLSSYLVGGFSYFTISAQFDFYFFKKHEKKTTSNILYRK